MDLTAYKQFKKLKEKFPHKMVVLDNADLIGAHIAYKDHREYVAAAFKKEGIVVTRWAHDYDSLNTTEPRIGVVYMANDSILNRDAFEAHVLIGHNAQYIAGARGEAT